MLNLTKDEIEYIKNLVKESKRSLTEICDEQRKLLPDYDWADQTEVDNEFKLIDSILNKLK